MSRLGAWVLALGVGALLGTNQSVWSQETDLHPVLESADPAMSAIGMSRAARLRGSAASDPDTVWIGHVAGNTGLPGVPGGYGPYRIGRGLNRPGKPTATVAENNGYWDFDRFNAGETDSL